jgi:hypothetical protein
MTGIDEVARVERLLRGALTALSHEPKMVPATVTHKAILRGARLRRLRQAAVGGVPLLAAVVVVLTVLSVQTTTPRAVKGSPAGGVDVQSWQRAARSPLSPREGATMVEAGREVLVFGGTDASPCPPTALCVSHPDDDLSDGAGYDPDRDTWRRLADAPVRLGSVSAVLVGDVVYVLTRPVSGSKDVRFLEYSIQQDRWTLLPSAPLGIESIVAVGGNRLVGCRTSQGKSTPADQIYDVATRAWTAMSRDPLAPSEDRNLVATDSGDLVLLAVDRAGKSEGWKFWQAALWNAKTAGWQKLPPSRIVDSDPSWFWAADRAVNPSTEIVGTTGLPAGGILDPVTGTWGSVPQPPAPTAHVPLLATAGEGRVLNNGHLLDVKAGTWRPLPAPPIAFPEQGTTARLSHGRVIVFGGASFEGFRGTLTNDTWLLRLP